MYLFCHAICDIPLEKKLVPQSNDLNWPVRVAQNISAPAAQVWELISTPGNLELCHPYCMRNPVTDWLGKSSKDEVHYYSGLIYEREFCAWIDEIIMPSIPTYKEKDLKSVNRSGAADDLKKESDKDKEKEVKPLIKKIKIHHLD